ncbi:hypothetical protein [Fluviispira multicolorata]|uniref:Uncharacterized protein n=1 Tax=Fluviispira multicolorata TaxID=2654512 RepID=A0A833JDW1_9BACT|nr:hypothetical protein [Fluviispira multicolorata]KAB8032103.1 hypothetical protein GCL57_05505 [Fluviispira multicolorata]
MSFKPVSFGLLIPALLSYNAFAGGPTINNKCALSNIKHPNNASGIAFDEECTTGYVLPPNIGKVTVSAVQQNSNLGICPALKNDLKALEESTKVRLILIEKISKMVKDYEPIYKEKEKLHLKLTEKESVYDVASSIYENVKTTDKKYTDEIDEARATYSRQSRIDPTSPETLAAKQYLDKLMNDYKFFLATVFNKAEENYYQAKKERNKASDDYVYQNNKYVEAIKPLLDLQTSVDNISSAAINSYQRYVILEGLTAQVIFDVDTNSLVQQYQQLNQNLNLHWQPMLIKDAMFSSSLKNSTGEADSTVSTLIDANIPGLKAQTIKNIDSSKTPPTLNDSESEGKSPFGSISGKIRLNLNGACTYYEDVNKPIAANNINNISANLALNVNYTYQLKARRSFKATYNLYNMFSRVERKTSNGGWFSTTSVNSVIEDKESKDWFSIIFDGDSSEFQYTKQEQDEITSQEKILLVDKALRQFAMINSGSTPPSLNPPPTSGIMYASAQLGRCYYYYCQVGSFVLGTFGSIFGNSTAVSDFKTNTNVWVEDKVNGYQILDRSSTLTFSSKL